MKKSQVVLLMLILVFLFIGFGNISNSFNRDVMNITLKTNQKLINVSWKDKNMWILTKEMESTDVAETYNFEEYSKYGILDGKLTINEKKGK